MNRSNQLKALREQIKKLTEDVAREEARQVSRYRKEDANQTMNAPRASKHTTNVVGHDDRGQHEPQDEQEP